MAKSKNKLHRNPKVENKYNLTMKDIRNLEVADKTKITEPLFWRNNVISAWCILGSTAQSNKDREYGTYNEFWFGVYDEDAKAYAGKVRVDFSTYGGMCGYKFEKFYQPKDIDCEIDLRVQEMFLEKINYLLDNGIFKLKENEVTVEC